jgi:alkylation response protein AidB-like acyl-CoA dehydrogenase
VAWVREQLTDDRGTTDAVWKGLAELGVLGVLVPASAGGAGMGMVDMGVVLEELGRALHPGPFTSSAVAAASVLARVGGDELLAPLADGSVVATLVPPVPALSGSVAHVPDGAAADVLLVPVADALYAVEGADAVATPTIDGTRKWATVRLDGAAHRLVASGPEVTAALAETGDRVLTAWCVDGVGCASAALAIAVDYAKERVQFDRPIGSFQAVQHLCADMLQQVELARAGAYYALWACDGADPAERHRAATMAKAWCSDGLWRVGAGTIQVLGGIGFTWEHDAHLFYKRLLTLQQSFGGASVHLEELAGMIL